MLMLIQLWIRIVMLTQSENLHGHHACGAGLVLPNRGKIMGRAVKRGFSGCSRGGFTARQK